MSQIPTRHQMPYLLEASTKSERRPWSPGLGAGPWQVPFPLQEERKARDPPQDWWLMFPVLLSFSWKGRCGEGVMEGAMIFHLVGTCPPQLLAVVFRTRDTGCICLVCGCSSSWGQQEMPHSLGILQQQQELRKAPLRSHLPDGNLLTKSPNSVKVPRPFSRCRARLDPHVSIQEH